MQTRPVRRRYLCSLVNLSLPVGLDLLNERGRQRHIIERHGESLTILQRPPEEGDGLAATGRILWLLVHEDEDGCGVGYAWAPGASVITR
jgi:hypothetical protein